MSDIFAQQTPLTVPSDAGRAGVRTRLAIAGMGTVGAAVVKAVVSGLLPETEITAVAARDVEKCRRTLDQIGCDAPVTSLQDLHRNADVVLECAPAAIFEQIVRPTVSAGKKAVVLSDLLHPIITAAFVRTDAHGGIKAVAHEVDHMIAEVQVEP